MPHPLSIPARKLGGTALLLVAALVCASILVLPIESAWAKPIVHTVYEGQRLGSIAKRYNVTVEALCQANNISPNAPIKPGQKLVIPGTDDGKGSGDNDEGKSDSDKSKKKEEVATKPTGNATIHVVAKGHTLSAISGRYAVTVTAICTANDLDRNASLTVGQKLVIPHKSDKDGSYARKQRLRGKFADELEGDSSSDEKGDDKSKASGKGDKTWEKYVKPAWRRGYIKIRRYDRSWAGYVIGPNGDVLGHASNKINFVMGAREDGPRIDPKLIRLISSVSDKFGGREMRIVSGYRTKSYVAASKHKQGKAIDFSIPGIPNEALRDYLRTIEGVGVGYYPNSSFVHLDVRGYNSYWIDHSGPGEAPRKSAKKKPAKPAEGDAGSDDSSDDSGDEGPGEGEEYDPDADKPDDGSSEGKEKSEGDASKEKTEGESGKTKDSAAESKEKAPADG